MLEPWEKILSSKSSSCFPDMVSNARLVVFVFTFFALLLASGLYQYLPQHVSIMRQRVAYYLFGQDGDDRLLWHFVDRSTLEEL